LLPTWTTARWLGAQLENTARAVRENPLAFGLAIGFSKRTKKELKRNRKVGSFQHFVLTLLVTKSAHRLVMS
jgi:hypothetical protein